jgi:transposase
MTINEVKKLIEFARDWNSGMSVPDMAKKYAVKEVTVRSRVASLRKKGVKLPKRTSGLALTEKDIAKINDSL